MKRTALKLASLVCLLLAAHTVVVASDSETWTSVRSRNFFLMGNATEREMRAVATRLEQFRTALSHFSGAASVNQSVPTTVIVFRADESYRPFKPLYQGQPSNVAGYFQASPDLNYITLSIGEKSVRPYGTIFHEYVHLFVEQNLRGLPLFLNEGLAEYFSTFEASDDGRKVTIGKSNAYHLRTLRTREWLPLAELMASDHKSPLYNERDKQDLFYAEAWALVHYLVTGRAGNHPAEFTRFVNLLAEGRSLEQSFHEAFQMEMGALEQELREYVKRDARPLNVTALDKRPAAYDFQMQSAPVTEAEAQYYLGDLLLHTHRLDEAEGYLKEALRLDPQLAMASASLGLVRVRQKRLGEALPLLERAARLAPENYLAHYYYAYALSRTGMNEEMVVAGYDPETARVMRAELLRAIELSPYYPESYRLLAFISLATGDYLDQAASLLRRAMTIAPGRQDFALVLAQIYSRKRDFKGAREILEPVCRSADAQLRVKAQSMLDTVASTEADFARLAASGVQVPEAASTNDEGDVSAEARKPKLPRRFDGLRVRGLLMNVECAADNIVLSVKVGERTLRLRNDNLRRISFVAYVEGLGRAMTCGPRTPANLVVLTYRPLNNPRQRFDGEAVAVEFVPEDLDFEQ